ncbi:FxsA family membrane protein [Streptomyces minutiscleroticus]|uniref:Membrane protein n=1 Tax=Streptomyces minutiscleroticus TaxID=68238 RepID=A0A918U599_9ACTN|nr:FxsA family membrane protein [Streptomyces minutiscleroticus]GGX92996.1 membrane protein [Streptomyces minutiscleroticus]
MTTSASTPTYPARPRRSRLRTLLPLGLAVWLVLEIWLLTLVANAAGGLGVLLLLVAGFVAGAAVVKRAGRRAFRNLNETLRQQQGGVPPRQARGGSEGNGLTMLGGLLLIMPGLVSDAVGLLLLVPPVQRAVSRYAERTFERKIRETVPGGFADAFQQARMHRPDGKVVQGEVVREDGSGASRRDGDGEPGQYPPLTR